MKLLRLKETMLMNKVEFLGKLCFSYLDRKLIEWCVTYGTRKNKYWEIYLTVLDFWTGQIFPKILYTFYDEALNFIEKKKECLRLIQAQSKNEDLSNFIVQFLKKL